MMIASDSHRGWLYAIWFAVSLAAAGLCLLTLPQARIGNEYFPMGIDSYYHAARILDAVQDPASFYEFDPKIHAPEGSLLVWPWGYDYAMAKLVRLGMAVGLSNEPIKILLWIPVVAVFAAIALLIAVARQLALSNWPVTLAALCMALSPTTQLLFGFGEIDHHYAELLCILASLACGLAWFRSPSIASGIGLGVIFGLALAIHNALFILPLPFLATLFARWLQGQQTPLRPVIALVLSLLGSTLAVLIPSLPFQLGRFEFYTLSWFHLYVMACSAVFILLLTRLSYSWANLVALIVIGIVALCPIIGDMRMGESFVSGTLGTLGEISEVQSPLTLVSSGQISSFYSYLIWLAPATIIFCAVKCWRERNSARLLFWISSCFGLALLATQIRMHYFGNHALYLPWLVVAQDLARNRPSLYVRTFLLATLALVLAYVPQLRGEIFDAKPKAGDVWFTRLHPLFTTLRKACAEDPGIVLADVPAGHYIRYYTRCSVIANPFLLTEQQFHKVAEVQRLFSLSANELVSRAPQIKYVLVRPANIVRRSDGTYSFVFFDDTSPRLAADLLFDSHAVLPSELQFLDQVLFEFRGLRTETFPYARLYKIPHRETSSNDVTK